MSSNHLVETDASVLMRLLGMLPYRSRLVFLSAHPDLAQVAAVFVVLEFVRALRDRSRRYKDGETTCLWLLHHDEEMLFDSLVEFFYFKKVVPELLTENDSAPLKELLLDAVGDARTVFVPCLHVPSNEWILFVLRGCRSTHFEEGVPYCCTTVNLERPGGEGGDGVLFRFMHNVASDLDAPNQDGFHPAYIASQHGHVDCLKSLKARGVDMNTLDDDGWSAAHIAAAYDQVESLEYLNSVGADLRRPNRFRRTPAALAIKYSRYRAIEYLRRIGQLIT